MNTNGILATKERVLRGKELIFIGYLKDNKWSRKYIFGEPSRKHMAVISEADMGMWDILANNNVINLKVETNSDTGIKEIAVKEHFHISIINNSEHRRFRVNYTPIIVSLSELNEITYPTQTFTLLGKTIGCRWSKLFIFKENEEFGGVHNHVNRLSNTTIMGILNACGIEHTSFDESFNLVSKSELLQRDDKRCLGSKYYNAYKEEFGGREKHINQFLDTIVKILNNSEIEAQKNIEYQRSLREEIETLREKVCKYGQHSENVDNKGNADEVRVNKQEKAKESIKNNGEKGGSTAKRVRCKIIDVNRDIPEGKRHQKIMGYWLSVIDGEIAWPDKNAMHRKRDSFYISAEELNSRYEEIIYKMRIENATIIDNGKCKYFRVIK